MAYDRQILKILSEVGERGLSVRLLAKNVYNMNCNLFSSQDFNEVYAYVQQYLLRNSKGPNSVIERTDKRGHYRLNVNNSSDARQLLFDFSEQQEEQDGAVDTNPYAVDMSLSLFD
ncbi:hypothetical protein [Xylanibacter muris]|uniref:Uncharacterized protein n=1 Tax=Xylanibacter muris TaxID=2736290 RepID=A0ABX2AKC2_9BACT|nr:hypothetical protein [Xylanibacter muris]NPD91318.1 hypothetical protein [Xylanibacter muris]